MNRSSVACSGVVAAPSAAGGAGPSPSDSVVAETAAGQAAAAGTAATYARGDHSHGTPADPVPAHVAAGDPHPQYQQAADVDGAIDGALVDHVAAADPHPGYQRESEKSQANGYASLGADGKVPAAELPASGGGGALSFQEADRATDLTLTTSYVAAVSLNLGVGTWLVIGQTSVESTSTTQGNVSARIRDTTSGVTHAIAEGEVDSALPDRCNLAVHAVVVLAAPATIALEGRQSAGTSHMIGPGNLADTATKVTRLTAVQIA